jgi:putative nucleotidyltransferase with HDIG domain
MADIVDHPPTESTATKRILAVDDEEAACKLLFTFLGALGFLCTTARSGEDALAALRRECFDAVISDLHMPGIGGMELLSEVRLHHPHLAFLVTTGVDDIEVAVKAMRRGADDYLVKPLESHTVMASLERAIRKRALELEVNRYRQGLEEMVSERTGQLKTALRQLECSYGDTLQALGAAIDLRDNETAGHSLRVSRYSLEMARKMGWSDAAVGSLSRGAYLHDIGKLGIPDGVLLKPGPLTPDERKLMQQHAQIGFDIVKGISFLADAAEIVLAHHERFDGHGYPRGLSGEQIPLGARIFSLADTLDAITSDRPYQRAASFASAFDTIRRLSGNHLDPQIVEVFRSIPEETWPAIARSQRQASGLPSRLVGRNFNLRMGLGQI